MSKAHKRIKSIKALPVPRFSLCCRCEIYYKCGVEYDCGVKKGCPALTKDKECDCIQAKISAHGCKHFRKAGDK